jgi:hypothetical protein
LATSKEKKIMHKNMPRLTLVGRRETPKELVEKATWRLMQEDLCQFARAIDTAREFWRSHRDLVEAPEMPTHLAALVNPDDLAAAIAQVRKGLMADSRLAEIVSEARADVDPILVEEIARSLMRVA